MKPLPLYVIGRHSIAPREPQPCQALVHVFRRPTPVLLLCQEDPNVQSVRTRMTAKQKLRDWMR